MIAKEGIGVGYGIKTADFLIRGKTGSPLVVHMLTEKARKEIKDKQEKKARKAKEARNPHEEFLAARYLDNKGRECVLAGGLKKAIITAASAHQDLTKVALRQALFIDVPDNPGSPFIPIEKHDGTLAIGEFREDPVTIGINTRSLAYRPGYNEWQLRIRIEYNPRLVSLEQLTSLLYQAGWGVGICEGRPEKSSALGWGRFVIVEQPDEVKAI